MIAITLILPTYINIHSHSITDINLIEKRGEALS